MLQCIYILQDTILFKQKQMVQLWKMKVSDEFYKQVLKETQQEIKDFNMNMLVNWEEFNK